MVLKETEEKKVTAPSELLRRGTTIQLYAFSTAHGLFQGSELEKAIHTLVSKSGAKRINIIDEGVFGPIELNPSYDLQLEDMRFTINRYVADGRATVVFGDNEVLCQTEQCMPRFLRPQFTTLRSKHILKVALAELAKDESVPTLVVAGVAHIAQIVVILEQHDCRLFLTNDMTDVMRRFMPDPVEYSANIAGLAQYVELAGKMKVTPDQILRVLG